MYYTYICAISCYNNLGYFENRLIYNIICINLINIPKSEFLWITVSKDYIMLLICK
jgi:hypothetical protein